MIRPLSLLVVAATALLAAATGATAEPQHGIAMHGEPALPADFSHFPYADPNAPKGGKVAYGVVGTFDSLNPFIVQSATSSARGLWDVSFGNNVFESLLTRNRDEAFTLYGLVADSVETPPDRSWVAFTVHPDAKFSDGHPLTAEDVKFTMELLRDKGRPIYRQWYGKVATIELVGERGIRFVFGDEIDRELPLLIGLMPILPKHATDPETFDRSTLTPPIGSGPYTVASVDAGQRIVLKRNPDYWAADLPSKRGFDNFDEIAIEYFRNGDAAFEAFKKGITQIQPEADPANWLGRYDFPALTRGEVVKESVVNGVPKGMAGYVFNTRRPLFADKRVRAALASLLDFAWINENLYFGAYERCVGYFNASELSAVGRAAEARERELLAPFPEAVEPAVMDGSYRPAGTKGVSRDTLRAALATLGAAGYALQGDRLVERATGTPVAFEILVTLREQERLALAYQRTLARIGIAVDVRLVDSAQYQKRVQTFDFDMIQASYSASLSPGNEQTNRWGSRFAELEGGFNYAGARDPAIDAMLDAMLAARSKEEFVAAVRALDRVLISGHYVVPLFYLPEQWVARWQRIKHPDAVSLYGHQYPTWWADPADR